MIDHIILRHIIQYDTCYAILNYTTFSYHQVGGGFDKMREGDD